MICVICGNETDEYNFCAELTSGGIERQIVAASTADLCRSCLIQDIQAAIEEETKS